MLLKNTAFEQRGVPADAPAQLDTFASAPKAVIEPISFAPTAKGGYDMRCSGLREPLASRDCRISRSIMACHLH
jgi:hypothetical protein